MYFADAASRKVDSRGAARAVAADVRRKLGSRVADLAIIFLTDHHLPAVDEIAAAIQNVLSPRLLLGCSAEGVIGGGEEIERVPGLSLLAASLPGVTLTPFSVSGDEWQEALSDTGAALRARVGAAPKAVVALADPFSTPVDEMLDAFAAAFPGVPLVGGMASGATHPGGNVLLLNDTLLEEGMIGIGISGSIRVETVVSQGCRPVGQPLRVTAAQDTVIESLRFRPALEMAQLVLSELPEDEQALLENGLYVGVVIDEYRPEFGRGDFLVRNVVGADMEAGFLTIADSVRPGQTIQFHLRDAATADEDLRLLLDAALAGTLPAGALLFSCNGRGTRLFDAPGHDVDALHEAVPGLPVAGFFAAGELGPVGGRSFLHGQTASLVLFRPE